MIRLGICTSIENAGLMKEIGYDYVELGFSAVAGLSEAAYEELLQQAKTSPLPVESMNGMLPGTFVLCSEEGTGEEIGVFLDLGFRRAAALGVRIVVFGSGAARNKPEGMSEEEAWQYLARFLRFAAGKAAPYGITIAVEPLRPAETNIIHHVWEAQKLSALADCPNIAALADLYHMMQGGDDFEAIDQAPGVVHTHIAEKEERRYPKKTDACLPAYEEFFRRLKRADYDGRVSVEGRTDSFAADAKEAFELLSSLR